MKTLPDDWLLSPSDFQQFGIQEGSDVFFSGMFLPYLGTNRNYPIVRFGKFALVTDEKVNWAGTPTDLYLIETFSFGGNSGSPVFLYLGSDRKPGTLVIGAPVLKLVGVMIGYFGEAEQLGVIETNAVPASKANMGIAAVVPAQKLHEILYGAELELLRHPVNP